MALGFNPAAPLARLGNKAWDKLGSEVPEQRYAPPYPAMEQNLARQIEASKESEADINAQRMAEIDNAARATAEKQAEQLGYSSGLGMAQPDALSQALQQRSMQAQQADIARLKRVLAPKAGIEKQRRLAIAADAAGFLDEQKLKQQELQMQAKLAKYEARMGVLVGLMSLGGQFGGMAASGGFSSRQAQPTAQASPSGPGYTAMAGAPAPQPGMA